MAFSTLENYDEVDSIKQKKILWIDIFWYS